MFMIFIWISVENVKLLWTNVCIIRPHFFLFRPCMCIYLQVVSVFTLNLHFIALVPTILPMTFVSLQNLYLCDSYNLTTTSYMGIITFILQQEHVIMSICAQFVCVKYSSLFMFAFHYNSFPHSMICIVSLVVKNGS